MVARSGQTGRRTIVGTDAGLIGWGGDGWECRGIERESGNITAILPQAGEAGRAALPHPFRHHGAVDHAVPKAIRRVCRTAVAGTLNAL
jgi:hypothetical protein